MHNIKAKPVSDTHPPFHVHDKKHARFADWQVYQARCKSFGIVPNSFRVWLDVQENDPVAKKHWLDQDKT